MTWKPTGYPGDALLFLLACFICRRLVLVRFSAAFRKLLAGLEKMSIGMGSGVDPSFGSKPRSIYQGDFPLGPLTAVFTSL